MSLSLNGVPVASMRWHAPWSGVWTAEVTLAGDVVPTGRAVAVSDEGISLSGTVDDTFSASFGEKRFVRLVAGGAGWQKPVSSQHYHSDVGVTLQVIAATTAALVGEIATVLLPTVVGVDFIRSADAAGRIFADLGVDWWVGTDGITKVGVRPPLTPPTSLEVLDWHPEDGTMRFNASVLVEPGTVIVDDRFGSRLVRSVEATVSEGSVTGTLWVVPSTATPKAGTTSELVDGLGAIARAATRAELGRFYEYRVVAMSGDRVEAQAVKKSDGMPDILPTSVWAGASGYRAQLTPGSRILVGFAAGDRTRPFVAFYEPPEGDNWRPAELDLDAIAKLAIGEKALAVVVGDAATAKPIARAPAILAFVSALSDGVKASVGPAGTAGPAFTALATAIDTAAAALAADCPSTKAVTS